MLDDVHKIKAILQRDIVVNAQIVTIIRYDAVEGIHGTAADGHHTDIASSATGLFEYAQRRGVSQLESATGLVAQILCQECFLYFMFGRVKTIDKALAGFYYRLGVRIGQHQQQTVENVSRLADVSCHIHRAIIVDVERGAFALQGR